MSPALLILVLALPQGLTSLSLSYENQSACAAASARTIDVTAPLDAPYAARFGTPTMPATEATLTIARIRERLVTGQVVLLVCTPRA